MKGALLPVAFVLFCFNHYIYEIIITYVYMWRRDKMLKNNFLKSLKTQVNRVLLNK